MSTSLRDFSEKPEEAIPLLEEQPGSLLLAEAESPNSGRGPGHHSAFFNRCIRVALLTGTAVLAMFCVHQASHSIAFIRSVDFDLTIERVRIGQLRESGFRLDVSAEYVLPKLLWTTSATGTAFTLLEPKTGEALAESRLPNLHIRGGKSVFGLESEPIRISDPISLAKWINQTARKKKLEAKIQILTTLHPHWTPFTWHDHFTERTLSIDLSKTGDLEKAFALPTLEDLTLEEAANDRLVASATVVFENPTPLEIDRVPRVLLDVLSSPEGVVIGTVESLENFKLAPKTPAGTAALHRVPFRAVLDGSTPKSVEAINRLAARYMLGQDCQVLLRGRPDSISADEPKWLRLLVSHLNLTISIPKPGEQKVFRAKNPSQKAKNRRARRQDGLSFVSAVEIKRTSSSSWMPEVWLEMNNPLPLPVTILQVSDLQVSSAKASDTELVQLSGPQMDRPLRVPPNVSGWPAPDPFPAKMSRAEALRLVHFFLKNSGSSQRQGKRRYMLVDVEGVVCVQVGDAVEDNGTADNWLPFELTFRFRRRSLPLFYENLIPSLMTAK